MSTGDGLLVRLPLAGRDLRPHQLAALAAAAEAFGNDRLEITRRGNLQIRGCTPDSAEQLRAELVASDVSLAPPAASAFVVRAGLAGLDATERADPRTVADAIDAELAAFGLSLPPKLTIVVDGGGACGVRTLRADIFVTAIDARTWDVCGSGQAPRRVAAADVPRAVSAALRAGLPDGRRAHPLDSKSSSWEPIGSHPLHDGRRAIGIAPPYGATDATSLAALARADVDLFRLGQDGVIFAVAPHDPNAFIAHATAAGFIVDAADPRRAIAACVGSEGCASALLATRPLADWLATQSGVPRPIHVSGCSKGCAHPGPAALTLVGQRDGRVGVVRHGTAREPASIDMPAAAHDITRLLDAARAA